ncbi:MAG: aldo/keto reductase [Flavobacterium sp.]|nr:MAG: aldo/keto reductase [Flavobacterium sp.]
MKNRFSPIIAGTMNWGVWGAGYSAPQMAALINDCVNFGITSFDHADIYGGYTTEADFGMAFAESGLSREAVQLITKCGIQHTEGRDNKVKHYDYSKQYIIWSAENSLRNLKTDYLDLLLLHRPSPLMQPDEIAEAIDKLKSEGKIKGFGVSNFTSSQTELIRSKIEVDVNQIEFSATHLAPMLDGSLNYMQVHGITPMAWSPVGSVFKVVDEQSARLETLLSTLEEKYSAPADVLLLAWILQHPAGILAVSGSTSAKRLESQIKATEITFELEDWFAVWTESMGHKVP